MNGGLGKMNRYLLAGASVIGLLAIGAPEAKAQDLKSIQSQIDRLQSKFKSAGHHQGPAKAGARRQGASLGGSDDCRQRQRQRSRPEGQMEGRSGD